LKEDEKTHEDVGRLKDEILDLFAAHPVEAEAWYQTWKGERAR
jgi:hypothetical protein